MTAPLVKRFEARVALVPESTCWYWVGSLNNYGYGSLEHGKRAGKRRVFAAHRLAYEIHVGPIPPGLTLDHLCRNRACVNPSHLEPVTRGENVLRGETIAAAEAKRMTCPRGHEYDYKAGNKRRCRRCDNAQSRRWLSRNREWYNALRRERYRTRA